MAEYQERLAVPMWWYASGLGGAILFGSYFAVYAVGKPAILITVYALFVLATLVILRMLSRNTISISASTLRVGQESVAITSLGVAEPLDRAAARRAFGHDLDPSAYTLQRGWIKTGLLVDVEDPDVGDPYWLFSTRHPDRLASALREARSASGRG